MPTVSLSGASFEYTDEGSGDPLVLVHGHPFDRSMWQPQIDHFAAAGWRVIAPDLRGYGRSSGAGTTTPLGTFAGDVVALLDHLGVERPVVGGLSMGGQIVLELYRLFPDRVRALVLADTFAAAETDAGKASRNATADRLLSEGMAPYADEVLPKMLAPHNIAAMPAVAEHVHGMMVGTSPEGAAAALRGRAERPDYVGLLPSVQVPTLVVVGSDDEYTPVGDAEVLRDGIPAAELEVVEGAGHMPNLERPAVFNAALARLLDSLVSFSTWPPHHRLQPVSP